MRKLLIPAVSLAALTLGSAAFSQTTTTESTATPSVDCAANPADPACANTTMQKSDPAATQPSGSTAEGTTATTPDTGTGTGTTTTTDTTAPSGTGTATTTDTGTAATGTPSEPATTGSTTATDPATTGTAATADAGNAGVMLSGDEFLASSFIGKTVYAGNRENIGDINDLVVSKDGKVKGAIIGVGGFLGIGEKDVMMPLDKITITKDENGSDMLTVAATRQELESAPAFDRTALMGGRTGTTGTATQQ